MDETTLSLDQTYAYVVHIFEHHDFKNDTPDELCFLTKLLDIKSPSPRTADELRIALRALNAASICNNGLGPIVDRLHDEANARIDCGGFTVVPTPDVVDYSHIPKTMIGLFCRVAPQAVRTACEYFDAVGIYIKPSQEPIIVGMLMRSAIAVCALTSEWTGFDLNALTMFTPGLISLFRCPSTFKAGKLPSPVAWSLFINVLGPQLIALQ